ncbi:MAG: SGNH/GDSL hydrolase family protein [Mycobacterium sp.]
MTATCILFFGDDIIAAASDTSQQGLDGRLQALLADAGVQSTGYNLGIVGETSAEVSRRWRKESYPRTHRSTGWHPFFCFGINDTPSAGESAALQALHKVITRCLQDQRVCCTDR